MAAIVSIRPVLLFGHLKDEFFRGRERRDFANSKRDLEARIVHWNARRRQVGLKDWPRRSSGASSLWCKLYLGCPSFGAQFIPARFEDSQMASKKPWDRRVVARLLSRVIVLSMR